MRPSAHVTMIAALALVLAGCTASPTSGSSSPSPSSTAQEAADQLEGDLFFTRTGSGDVQSVHLLREGREQVVTEPGEVCCVLRAAPSGGPLLALPGAFEWPLTGVTMDRAGGEQTPLPSPDGALSLVPQAWSPDGASIAYEGWDESDPSRTGSYVGPVDGSAAPVMVTSRPGELHDIPLDFSPDGTRLVLYRSAHPDPDPYTGGSLWVVNLDGSGLRAITGDATRPAPWARWSPDGSRILFAAERLSQEGPVWTVAPEGGEVTVVHSDPDGGFAIYPVWSPDGTEILFGLDPSNDEFTHPPNKVFVMSADGSDVRLVLDSPDCKRSFDWTETGS